MKGVWKKGENPQTDVQTTHLWSHYPQIIMVSLHPLFPMKHIQYVAEVATKWLDISIRVITESAALYPSATLAGQVKHDRK